jgi:hypothetical protein
MAIQCLPRLSHASCANEHKKQLFAMAGDEICNPKHASLPSFAQSNEFSFTTQLIIRSAARGQGSAQKGAFAGRRRSLLSNRSL